MGFHTVYGKLGCTDWIITFNYIEGLCQCPCSDENPDGIRRWAGRLQTPWKEIQAWRSYTGTLKDRQIFENGTIYEQSNNFANYIILSPLIAPSNILSSHCPPNQFRKKLSAGTGTFIVSVHALYYYEFSPFMYQHIPVYLVWRCPRVIPLVTRGTVWYFSWLLLSGHKLEVAKVS